SLVATADIELRLFDLDIAKAAALASRVGRLAPKSRICAIETIAGEFDLVVNASTSGMLEHDPSPVPKDIVARASLIADIVVDRDTELKRDARRYDRPLIEGEAMVRG